MQICIGFILPAETKAEAQTKLQSFKQSLANAGIIPQQIRISVVDRQNVDYAKIGTNG